MITLTFEQLPEAVSRLTTEVSQLKHLLIERTALSQPEPEDQFLNIREAAQFLSLTVPTMYCKVSKGELPVMKRSKRLYFSRTELLNYLKEGRKKTTAEIETESAAYISKRKKGLNNGK